MVSEKAADTGGSRMFLDLNSEVSVGDLLFMDIQLVMMRVALPRELPDQKPPCCDDESKRSWNERQSFYESKWLAWPSFHISLSLSSAKICPAWNISDKTLSWRNIQSTQKPVHHNNIKLTLYTKYRDGSRQIPRTLGYILRDLLLPVIAALYCY